MSDITWSWQIGSFSMAPDANNLADVVKSIPYTVMATRDDKTITVGGRCNLKTPSDESFTPFEELTKDVIVSWILDDMRTNGVLNNIEARMNANTIPAGTPRFAKEVEKQKKKRGAPLKVKAAPFK